MSDIHPTTDSPDMPPGELPSEVWPGMTLDLECPLVDIQFSVELPFWLMMPDAELTVAFGNSSLKVCVTGDMLEIQASRFFQRSGANVLHLGPLTDSPSETVQQVIRDAKNDVILRRTRTFLTIHTKALADCTRALFESGRRTVDARMYFQCLAYAHIPFVNRIINAYRQTAGDPFAMEVTEWDVPIWFVSIGDRMLSIPLVPYGEQDGFPTLTKFKEDITEPVHLADATDVQAALAVEESSGAIDLLDAWTLYYRGRFGEAIRSLVTAIEVVLEAKLRDAFLSAGHSEKQVEDRLSKTLNDFGARLNEYSTITGRRVPGPILSIFPWINGVRLTWELEITRRLRHKIVHEGLHLDHSMYPHLQRPMETMTWLYNWFRSDSPIPVTSMRKKYPLMAMMHGHVAGLSASSFPPDYTADGVILRCLAPDANVPVDDFSVGGMLLKAMDGQPADFETFALTSLSRLGFRFAESAMPTAASPFLHERCFITDSDKTAVVFLIDTHETVGRSVVEQAATRLLALSKEGRTFSSALCIVNHQNGLPWQLRDVANAFTEDVISIAESCGITVVTAADLLLLTIGADEYSWDLGDIRASLANPGRQAKSPPGCMSVGTVKHFYERPQVISVAVNDSARVRVGDMLVIRLRDRYHQQTVESLQVNGVTVVETPGGVLAGIQTSLHRGDVPLGAPLYVIEGGGKQSEDGVAEGNGDVLD